MDPPVVGEHLQVRGLWLRTGRRGCAPPSSRRARTGAGRGAARACAGTRPARKLRRRAGRTPGMPARGQPVRTSAASPSSSRAPSATMPAPSRRRCRLRRGTARRRSRTSGGRLRALRPDVAGREEDARRSSGGAPARQLGYSSRATRGQRPTEAPGRGGHGHQPPLPAPRPPRRSCDGEDQHSLRHSGNPIETTNPTRSSASTGRERCSCESGNAGQRGGPGR